MDDLVNTGTAPKQKLLVVLGPTASGKTALAIQLAQQFSGQIISADSMQIYKGLDVGTAKATKQERLLVPHHLLDIATPSQTFSVASFLPLCRQAIQTVAEQGALPIVCGGTGLYLSALVDGISFEEEKADDSLRAQLKAQFAQKGSKAMWERLCEVDPESAHRLHPNDEKRILRALELFEKTGRTMSQQQKASRPAAKPYDVLLLGLMFSCRQDLYDRINLRVEQMAQNGIEQEARLVYQNRAQWPTAAQAIGYKEYFPYFEGKASWQECTEKLKQATRNYAKRQLSWFRRMDHICWLNAENPALQAQQLVQRWLDSLPQG